MYFQVYFVCVTISYSKCCVSDNNTNSSTTNSISRTTNSSTTKSQTTSLSTDDDGPLTLKDLEEQLIIHDTRVHEASTGLGQQMKDLLRSHSVLDNRLKAIS